MARIIKIEVVDDSRFNKVLVKVVEQSNVGSNFGNTYGGKKFVASNGFVLGSNLRPAKDDTNKKNLLWVRGTDRSKNDTSVAVTREMFDKLKVAVKEYNAYYTDAAIWARMYGSRPVATPAAPVEKCCYIIS